MLVGLAVCAFFSLAYPLIAGNVTVEITSDNINNIDIVDDPFLKDFIIAEDEFDITDLRNTTSKGSVTITKEYKIDLLNIIIFGSILFVIFHAEIRRINLGPVGIETRPSRAEGATSSAT